MAIVYGLKVNLSVAMVGMLNHTALELSAHDARNIENSTIVTDVDCEPAGSSTVVQVRFIFIYFAYI